MARIPIIRSFTPIPEGYHIFKITEVKYDADFGQMDITMQTKSGQRHIEKFHLKNADDSMNDKAMGAFGYFATMALNDNSITDIDPEDMVGHFIKCEVKHNVVPNRNDPTKTATFVNLGEKLAADGFEGDEPAKTYDLSQLLG